MTSACKKNYVIYCQFRLCMHRNVKNIFNVLLIFTNLFLVSFYKAHNLLIHLYLNKIESVFDLASQINI